MRQREHRRNANRSTQEIFEEIYAEGKWGGLSLEDGSGSGSDEKAAQSYIDLVNEYLRDHPEIHRIVDIGCGDFRVARNFVLGEGQTYLGTDIVAPLVKFNEQRHGNDRLSFMQLDATTDVLPEADLYLVRQVLQHLSNDDALRLLEKVCAGRYALITEHHPAPDHLIAPNLDKPTGPDVRVYDGSGIYLDHEPFNVSNIEIVLQAEATRGLVGEGETLTTYLVQNR
ncbi:MAG: class I SAM-dependent methyltransferase [Pseudomonadales bacterium]